VCVTVKRLPTLLLFLFVSADWEQGGPLIRIETTDDAMIVKLVSCWVQQRFVCQLRVGRQIESATRSPSAVKLVGSRRIDVTSALTMSCITVHSYYIIYCMRGTTTLPTADSVLTLVTTQTTILSPATTCRDSATRRFSPKTQTRGI
jgi:hypothetical protein